MAATLAVSVAAAVAAAVAPLEKMDALAAAAGTGAPYEIRYIRMLGWPPSDGFW